MMKPETYIYYLEAVVLSLLNERERNRIYGEIASTDTVNPSLTGVNFAPYNIVEQIVEQRAARV